MKTQIKIFAVIVYTLAAAYAGHKIGFTPCAPCAKSETKTQKDQGLKAHVTGTVKKKCDPTAPSGGDVEIDFTADIETFLRERSLQTVTGPSYPRGDNIKLFANSKAQLGIEIMPKNHHWLGYAKDLQTQENIYQYSYSNRIGIFD